MTKQKITQGPSNKSIAVLIVGMLLLCALSFWLAYKIGYEAGYNHAVADILRGLKTGVWP